MISIEDRASAERDLCSDVVVDRGCSQAAVAEFHLPLQKLGVPVTMDLRVNQRGEVPGVGPARPIDGHLFAEHLPGDLVALDMPPMGSTSEEKKPYIARYDQRARYRHARHATPPDGTTRWKHPVSAGYLRARTVPASMSKSRKAPLVSIPAGADLSIVTAGADALPLYQPCLHGTTAHHAAYGRRQLVETVNSQLHGAAGAITNWSRGCTRSMRTGRIQLYVAWTIAGFNRRSSNRWLSARVDMARDPRGGRSRSPRKGRARRWADLPAVAGASPPG